MGLLFILGRVCLAAYLTAARVGQATLYTTVLGPLYWRSWLLPWWAAAEPVAEQSLRGDPDSSVNEQVEGTNTAQTKDEVEEEQDGGVGATPGTMEATRAHLWHKRVNRPERAKAGQAQPPRRDQEQSKTSIREDSIKHSPLGHQEISAHGHQAEGDDGDRVGEEEEQAEDAAPELTAAPPEVQVGVDWDGLQDGAVQEVSCSQVDDQHIEASPQTWV